MSKDRVFPYILSKEAKLRYRRRYKNASLTRKLKIRRSLDIKGVAFRETKQPV